MTEGALYGVGVGPGDPDLITVKAVQVLSEASHIFTPQAEPAAESLALKIAEKHVNPSAEIHTLVFPMLRDREKLEKWWGKAAGRVAEVLREGEDGCFLTLGDPLLYSTYIYLMRRLKELIPGTCIHTVPGITAMNAAAALTDTPLGEGDQSLEVVPAVEDLQWVRRTLQGHDGTAVLMKIGRRLPEVLDMLEELGLTQDATFVARAGLDRQRVETDVTRLRGEEQQSGYLSIMLVRCGRRETER